MNYITSESKYFYTTIIISLYKEVREGDIMRKKRIIVKVSLPIRFVSKFLVHQSSVDLDETEDLKELHSLNDLFMIH